MLSSRVTPAAFPDAVGLAALCKPRRPSSELALLFKKEVMVDDGTHYRHYIHHVHTQTYTIQKFGICKPV